MCKADCVMLPRIFETMRRSLKAPLPPHALRAQLGHRHAVVCIRCELRRWHRPSATGRIGQSRTQLTWQHVMNPQKSPGFQRVDRSGGGINPGMYKIHLISVAVRNLRPFDCDRGETTDSVSDSAHRAHLRLDAKSVRRTQFVII